MLLCVCQPSVINPSRLLVLQVECGMLWEWHICERVYLRLYSLIENANFQGDSLPELHRNPYPTQELKFNPKNLNELAQNEALIKYKRNVTMSTSRHSCWLKYSLCKPKPGNCIQVKIVSPRVSFINTQSRLIR